MKKAVFLSVFAFGFMSLYAQMPTGLGFEVSMFEFLLDKRHIVNGIFLIVLGLLTSPLMLLPTEEQRKQYQDERLIPYGKNGFIFAFIGLLGIIDCFLHTDFFSMNIVQWITLFITSITGSTLGIMLGYGAMQKDKKEKDKETIYQLRPFQATLSIIAFAIGIWQIIACCLW